MSPEEEIAKLKNDLNWEASERRHEMRRAEMAERVLMDLTKEMYKLGFKAGLKAAGAEDEEAK